jgi:hypothetical protein
MKYILGMVKSHLNLKGAKNPKLELDYLRIVYAVKEIRKQGDNAQGYLAVLSPDIQKRLKRWDTKYQAKGCVSVVYKCLPSSDESKMKREKTRNVAGMIAGTMGSEVGGCSSANFSQKIGEEFLEEAILESEQGVRKVTDVKRFPFDIRWDFYGEVDDSSSP